MVEISSGDAVIYLATLIGAVGVLWRGIYRPIRRLVAFVHDLVDDWRQNLEAVRELTHVVARYIVESDRRITRLEALRDLDGVVREHHLDDTTTLIGQQLEQALRHPAPRHDAQE